MLVYKFKYLGLIVCLIIYGFINAATPAAVGPDPCSATNLPSNMLTFVEVTLTGGASSVPDPGCGDFEDNDTWFSFTVPASGAVAIELEEGTVTDAGFALYSGPCGNPTRINCVPNYLCGEDPMAKFFYEDLPPGAVMYLRVWSMDGTLGTVNIRIADPFGNPYLLTGNATPVSFAGSSNCIKLTNATTNQLGCAWYPEEVDFSEPFTYEFSIYLGNNPAGADGMCIVFQNNGIPTCGISGGGIGAQGIPNSWIVEFDTWQNDYLGDPFEDHVAININGVMTHGGFPPVVVGNLEDGEFHIAVVSWNPAGNIFSVSLDGTVLITTSYDIVGNIFGGNPIANWGVTASTGGAFNEHILCFENIELENASPIYEEQLVEICFGEEVFLEGDWQTEPGVYVDFYVAGNGCDSIVTTTLEIVSGPTTEIDTVLCFGEVLSIGGNIYTQAGTYELNLTTASGCDSLVIIELEILEFTFQLQGADPFGCGDISRELSVEVSPMDPDIVILWSTQDGDILGPVNEGTITITAPGTYEVNVVYNGGTVSCPIVSESLLVEGDFEEPLIIIEEIGEFSCTNNTIILDATATQGDEFIWFTIEGGDIVQGEDSPVLIISGPGIYELTVINLSNNCSSTIAYEVLSEGPPNNDIFADPIDELTCDRDTTIINASFSQLDDRYTFQWQTPNGHIVPGTEMGLTPSVTLPGMYWFILLEIDGNCTDTIFFQVEQNIDTLPIDVISVDTLTCSNTEADILVAIQGNQQAGLVWTAENGTPFDISNNGRRLITTQSDTFHLQVNNLSNGCKSEVSIFVPEDRVFPEPLLPEDTLLTCRETALSLVAIQPLSGPYAYQWSAQPGTISGSSTGTQASVTAPGLYIWSVRNTRNGCESRDSILVADGRVFPEIITDLPLLLTCDRLQVNLEANVSPDDLPYTFTWSGPESGGGAASFQVGSPGIYTLEVINEASGCSREVQFIVEADTVRPIASAGPGFTLNCEEDEFRLDGSNSSQGPDYNYQWTSNQGNILEGAQSVQAMVNAPGWYVLEVVNTSNGCSSKDSVQILRDEGLPEIVLQLSGVLNCRDSSVFIDAAGSSQGASYEVFWNTANGNIVNISNRYLAEVNEPGTYVIEILNTENQCLVQREILVELDREPPIVITGPELTLTCERTTVTPQADGSSQGGNFTYEWSTLDGNIVSGAQSLLPVFNSPGTYLFTITNSLNHCSSTAALQVGIDTTSPVIVLQEPEILTCAVDEVILSSSGSSSGNSFQFEWSTIDGLIRGSSTGGQIEAVRGGTYRLLITNTMNGCSSEATVLLEEDRNLPDISLQSIGLLTCVVEAVTLSAAGSATGANITYEWTGQAGSLMGPVNEISAQASQVGWYQLIVEDLLSGCRSIDSVFVNGDFEAPLADAGPNEQLTCDRSRVVIQGSGSANGAPVSLEWSTNNGQILEVQGSGRILTDRAGWYVLRVVNNLNGCEQLDSMQVLPNLDGIDSLHIQAAMPDCFRRDAYIRVDAVQGGQAPYTYELRGWGEPGTQSVFDPVPPGTYELWVSDANGCTSRQIIEVNEVIPVEASIPPLYIIDLGDAVMLEPTFNKAPEPSWTYTWTPNLFLSCTDCESPLANPIETQAYRLLLIDENGCQARVQTLVRVIRQGGVYVPNAFSPGNGDGINDFFTIFSKPNTVNRILLMEVFDRWGNKVFLKEDFPTDVEEEGWDGRFKGQLLNPGTYVYRAEIEWVNGYIQKLYGEVNLFR